MTRYEHDRNAVLKFAHEAVEVVHYPHQAKGPGGINLETITLRFGPEFPEYLNVISVALHGIEGLAGGDVILKLLEMGLHRQLPPKTGLLIIFALNAPGYAWEWRVDWGNVDNNRNFTTDRTTKCDYARIAALLHPVLWDTKARNNLLEAMRQDPAGFRDASSGGQYDHPDGIFHGGDKPSETHIITHTICQRIRMLPVIRVSLIDIHTGIGENGKGDIISSASSQTSALAQRVSKWFPDAQFPCAGGEGVSSPVTGAMMNAFEYWLPDCEILAIALEMGGPVEIVENILRIVAENWIRHHPGILSPEHEQQIRDEFREVFYPDSEFWRGALWSRFRNVYEIMNLYLQST